MEFLIRFIQMHESFRKPETDAIADLLGLEIDWIRYAEDVRPFGDGGR
jgi:tRNA (guanine10-N2)-methyltransferase